TALVALAGPGVHLAIALGLAALHLGLVAAGLGGPASWVALALFFNVLYMVFNLIPLAPLDGHHVARWVVAEPLRRPRLAEWLFGPLVPPAKGLLVVLRDPGALRGGLDAWDRSLAASNAPLSRELEEDLAAAGLDPEILRTFGARVAAADPELNAVFLQLPPKAKGRNEELETALTKLGFNFYQATWGGFRAVRADFEARRESPVVRGFSAPFEQAARSAVHFYILAVTLLLLSSYLLAAVQAVSALLLSGSGALAGAP
ncbi:MAG TPA: hypothetical protein VNI01_09945, partial [Elusimicrobiota bacterium]|nr:hypothetical protein [Elusimicrobiota bacterium]